MNPPTTNPGERKRSRDSDAELIGKSQHLFSPFLPPDGTPPVQISRPENMEVHFDRGKKHKTDDTFCIEEKSSQVKKGNSSQLST